MSQSEQGLSSQESWGWQPEAKKVLLPFQLSAELGPDFKQGHILGLLSVSGWSHVLRLAWPKVNYPTLRPALINADWVTPAEEANPKRRPVPGPDPEDELGRDTAEPLTPPTAF